MLTISTDISMRRQQLETHIAGELVESLDLKNKEVVSLNKRIDIFVKQTGALERRMVLTQLRKKK